MTKEERNKSIIKDILAGMSNKELHDKYGLAERTIRRIAKENGVSCIQERKMSGGDVLDEIKDESFDIEDLREENELLQEHIEALEATVKELKADTAHIGHASIEVLDENCSKDYIIHIIKSGNEPEQTVVRTYEEAVNILIEYNPRLDDDYIRKTLSTYDQKTERQLGGRTTIMPNHGTKFKALNNDVKDWKTAFNELDKRIDDLENRL